MPSNPKRPSQEPMWRGVIVSCSIIAACLFPLAIAGYWAYGNRVSSISFSSIFSRAKDFNLIFSIFPNDSPIISSFYSACFN